MNNFNSDRELKYLPRWLAPRIAQASQDHPVVILTGARQVGKSTLLRNAEPFRAWRYVTLDNLDTLAQAERDPESLWAGLDAIVVDEVQKAPNLLSAVKHSVDKRGRNRVRFLLSGSANLLLMKQAGESLAGRAVYFVLHPMTIGERLGQAAPSIVTDLLAGTLPADGALRQQDEVDLNAWMRRGFMPPLFEFSREEAWVEWWEGYVSTYLERDLRQVAQIDALVDFRRMMQFAALRTGNLLNQSEIARDAQMSQATTHRYLNVLETMHLAQRVISFAGNRGVRMVKAPKLFWNDTGLAVFLCGYFDAQSLAGAREFGALFENMIAQHLNALLQLVSPRPALHYWRTQRGEEIDFVIEQGRRLLAIEVKLSDLPQYADIKHLQAFIAQHPHASVGVLIHGGDEIRRMGEKIIALPWRMFTG